MDGMTKPSSGPGRHRLRGVIVSAEDAARTDPFYRSSQPLLPVPAASSRSMRVSTADQVTPPRPQLPRYFLPKAGDKDQVLTKLSDADSDVEWRDANGLPPGYTFEEFTICDSGEPATRWWPTWLTDPTAPPPEDP